MHSLGDVWHPGPGVPCFGGFGGFCSLWGLTVSLSSLFFPILMHSLGDVWHPGPGVPCFGGFAGFAAFGGSPLGAHSLTFFPILPYLNAFLGFPVSEVLEGFAAFGGSPLGAHSLIGKNREESETVSPKGCKTLQNLRNREPQGQDAKRHLRNALR